MPCREARPTRCALVSVQRSRGEVSKSDGTKELLVVGVVDPLLMDMLGDE